MGMIKVVGVDESGDFETIHLEYTKEEKGRKKTGVNSHIQKEDIRFIGGYSFAVKKEELETVKEEMTELLKSVCTLMEKQCHQKKPDDPELAGLCENLKIQPHPVEQSYHILFPASLHGSAEKGISKVFFQAYQRGLYQNVTFPQDMKQRENLLAWEQLFQKYLEAKMISFISGYQGKLFCYLYPRVVLDAKENKALYENMVTQVVKNQFFNGIDEIYPAYAWEIATRVIPIDEQTEWNKHIEPERYEKQAGSGKYLITNLTGYRVLMRTILADAKESDIGTLVQKIQDGDFKVDIKSIKYHNQTKVPQEIDGTTKYIPCIREVDEADQTPFHYMADVACGLIRSMLQSRNWADCAKSGKGISDALSGASEVLPGGLELEIRIFGEQDERLIQMIHALRGAKIHDFFDLCYEMEHATDEFSRFYMNKWIPKLDSMLEQNLKKDGYMQRHADEASRLINRYMTVDRKYDRGTYIVEQFFERIFGWQLKRSKKSFRINKEEINIPKETYFSFILNLLRGYNHRGAAREPQKIIDWVEESGILNILYPHGELNFYNVCLQYYFNSLQYEKVFDEAFNLELKASDSIQGLSKLMNKENPLIRENQMEQAKIFSSAGQACGFLLAEDQYDHILKTMGVNRELVKQAGIENYQKALRAFEELGQNGNYDITMSHYLQYLCLLGDRQGYEGNAEIYFGSGEIQKQLKKAVTADLYYLRVFVKAMKTFYMEEEFVPSYMEQILEYVKHHKDRNHPMELIEAELCQIQAICGDGKIDMEGEVYKRAVTPIRHEDDVILLIRFHLKLKAILEHRSSWKDDLLTEHIDRYDENTDHRKDITVSDLYTVNLFGEVLKKRAEEMTFGELELFLDAKLGYEYC